MSSETAVYGETNDLDLTGSYNHSLCHSNSLGKHLFSPLPLYSIWGKTLSKAIRCPSLKNIQARLALKHIQASSAAKASESSQTISAKTPGKTLVGSSQF